MPASEEAVEPRRAWPWLLVYAITFVLSFEPVGWWFLAPVSVLGLTWAAERVRGGWPLVLGAYAVSVATWLWLHLWLIDVSAFGYPFLAAYLGLYLPLFVVLYRRVRRRWPSLPRAVVVPVLWVGLEMLRGEIVAYGYPWYVIGQAMIGALALVQSADLLGVYMVSGLMAMLAGAVVDALAGHPRRRAVLAAAGVLLGLDLGYGMFRLREPASGDSLAVLVIQTNLPQDNKIGWPPEKQAIDVPRFIAQTEAAVAGASEPPDLIVWPETMLPGAGLERDTLDLLRASPGWEHLYHWPDELVALQRRLGVPILVGATALLDVTEEPVDGRIRLKVGREFNSAYLVHGDPPFARYDKVHLTPFGETMPYISAWPWLEEQLLGLGAAGMSFNLDAADEHRTLAVPGLDGTITIGTPICYEDTVGRVCRRFTNPAQTAPANVLVNLSNDGWFGEHDAIRRQHIQIARFRAIESRVPLIRAVNTGQSVAVDHCGRLLATVGEGRFGSARTPGALSVTVAAGERTTLYMRVGDIIGWLALAGSAGLVLWRRKREPASAG